MFKRFISSILSDCKSGIVNLLVTILLFVVLISVTVGVGFLISSIPVSFFQELVEDSTKKHDMFRCYIAFGSLGWITAGLLFGIYGIFGYFRKKWHESKVGR